METLHKKNTFISKIFVSSENICTFASSFKKRHAQMAESVDALVSNTSGAIHPGSIPGLGTRDRLITCELSACFYLWVIQSWGSRNMK